MKVILLNDYGHVQGGSAHVAIESALGLRANNIEVSFFSGTAPLDSRLAAVGVRTVCVGQLELLADTKRRAAASRGLANTYAARIFDDFLEDFDPAETIIHCHGWTKCLSPLIFKPAFTRKFKVIVTAHEYFLMCPNGGFFIFPQGQYCRLKPLSYKCLFTNCDPRQYGHKLWRFARSIYQDRHIGLSTNISGIIAVSQICLDTLREHGPLPEVPTEVIFNPVDVQNQPMAVPANGAPFVYIGRFSPEKGIRNLITAAGALANHPFLFIGNGELDMELRQAFPQAEFVGWLPKAAMLERLRLCKALIFPSVWNETFGLVVAEALAVGVPVVCSRYSGAAALIEHGRNGWIYDARCERSLPAILDELTQSDILMRARSEAHASYWNNPLTITRHIDQLMSFYERVLRSDKVLRPS